MVSSIMEILGVIAIIAGLSYVHPTAGAVVGGLGLIFLAQGVRR